MSKNYFLSGQWNVICDVCSRKIKSGQAKQRWDGFIVCPDDFEYRHPQDFVKAKTDKITVPFTRPRPPDIFVGQQALSAIFTDSSTITDNLVIGYAFDLNLTDSVSSPTDAFTYGYALSLSLSDSLSAPTDVFTYVQANTLQLTDSITVTDTYTPVSAFSKSFTDSATATETLELNTTWIDSVTSSSSGSLVHQNYADYTYFAENYVSTTYTF